jgi:hypothetical protein
MTDAIAAIVSQLAVMPFAQTTDIVIEIKGNNSMYN